MKKAYTALIFTLLVFAIFFSGCGDSKEEKEEWDYADLEENFGGVIELDCASLQDCLNLLSWEKYNVCGYVVDVNEISPDILTISDTNDGFDRITVSQGEIPHMANVREFVYASGNVISSLGMDGYHMSGDVYSDGDSDNYMSVSDFLSLMDKIYEKTYFRTDGIIFQDGEYYDGSPRYYLYPSEESYKEDKLRRVEVSFLEAQTNVIGKKVTIIGKPDKDALIQGLKDCSIVE